MTYEKIFAEVKKIYSKADKKILSSDFAFQFNIDGEGGGSFYVAFRGGILEVAPYDYVDRSALLTASGEDFIRLAGSKFTLEEAVESGAIKIDGDYELALELNKLAQSAAEKKEAAKKAKSVTSVVKKITPAKKTAAAIKTMPEKKDLV
ncbi:MAG: SCP2 sterol-binding domain-containing protein [Oscillospiraceae bacterium]|nr:SCP2 sterol-binding domain-containing protein [Oscillospiraceae bacterium]